MTDNSDDGASTSGEQSAANGELLGPERSSDGHESEMGNFYLAQISNYTDRPDLLIAEIEKHDPGFVKRMNEASEHDATEMRAERFKFGKVQAYSSMFLSTGAAIAILCVLTLAVALGHIGFGTIIALGIFYAITQGGSSGFAKLITSISRAVERLRFGTNDSSSQTTKDHAEH